MSALLITASIIFVFLTLFYIYNSVVSALRIQNDRIGMLQSTITEAMSSSVANLTTNVTSQFNALTNNVSNVGTQVTSVQHMARSVEELSSVILNTTKRRGEAGEESLGNLLHDFLAPEQVHENFAIGGGSVEYAIRVASAAGADDHNQCFLVIDAKMPFDRYREYIEAKESGDSKALKSAFGLFATEIRREAEDVKKYTDKREGNKATLPLGILYFPFETIYTVVASDFRDLVAEIRRNHNVLITGPHSLCAIISSIRVCNRLFHQNENSTAVFEILQGFNGALNQLEEQIESTRKNLSAGQNHLNGLGTRVNQVRIALQNLSKGS